MIDLIVELQSAGNLLKNLADTDTVDRDFLLEMLGDRLLLLAGRITGRNLEEVGQTGNSVGSQRDRNFAVP